MKGVLKSRSELKLNIPIATVFVGFPDEDESDDDIVFTTTKKGSKIYNDDFTQEKGKIDFSFHEL